MSRRECIELRLQNEYTFVYLSVEDESHQHHVPENAQTHYKVILVSADFIGLTRVNRHKLINQLLKEEFNHGMHALSMHLYTPDEWSKKNQAPLQSPSCKDGYER